MRSLIVEDDYASRIVLQRFLMAYGETDIAVDGGAGLALFTQALDNGTRYDLVCLDIMLPEMSGISVLKTMRALEVGRSLQEAEAAHIFMVSALGDKESVVSALPLCDAYLVKPIRQADLVTHLKRVGLIP